MNYKNCLSNKTRNTLRKALNEETAQELFSVINGLCEEVERLRREKLDKRMMFDHPDMDDGPSRNNEY
ncbi:MAG: hypothetical protein V3S97_11190 [Candidatus Bathyarchaeia archaeon]